MTEKKQLFQKPGAKPQVEEKKLDVATKTTEQPDSQITEKDPQQSVQKSEEQSIPLSMVEEMMQKMKADFEEKLKKIESSPAAESKEISNSVTNIKNENFDEIPELQDFEPKDRIYVLLDNFKPVSHGIRTRHKTGSTLQYLNPRTKEVHPLRFSRSQVSFFTDKQKGDVTVEHVLMKDGMLKVSANDVLLQKFLFIHPDNEKNGGKTFKEYNPADDAKIEIEKEDELFAAQKLARELNLLKLDAIARLMCSDYKEEWQTPELKRALYNEISKAPNKFIRLANDYSLEAKGVAKTANHRGIIDYKNYRFFNEDGQVICEVQRNEDEWDAIAAYLLSGDGRSFYDYLKNAI